jgi:hypothetical protein
VIVATPPPVIQLAIAPDAVVGRRFRAGEGVVVRLAVGKVVKELRVRADGQGTFRVRASTSLALDICHGRIVVTASGADGSRARAVRDCSSGDPATP